ncbi:unnamed protein product [Pleuronectes platessa]|uniref:Uncharacterized protein n=1 Tax=Pleuronectes platessa TaxID=8262 RepID=A0A9N7VGV2_PLEPL|nr:unnamed protein product [Pleuronectes platessa]
MKWKLKYCLDTNLKMSPPCGALGGSLKQDEASAGRQRDSGRGSAGSNVTLDEAAPGGNVTLDEQRRRQLTLDRQRRSHVTLDEAAPRSQRDAGRGSAGSNVTLTRQRREAT